MDTTKIQVGELTLRFTGCTVHYRDKTQSLPPKHFQLLCFLARRKDCVVPKDELYRALYPENSISMPTHRIIDIFIAQIRKKLRVAFGENFVCPIGTLWGHGYEFQSTPRRQAPARLGRTGLVKRLKQLEARG